ncbi:AbrB/MazE/SpoVT family DNA-binding domain-containing protein [Patescibacteria group bacterium]|nr:AbrB/MazE/SpoVT family DNA-binding domain-containing protein [Patescibacteria group bacterium]MBU1123107.1 AbrB/MazE/SpoVT family DNA-binding domain-containing protein [Patescibacteria group bacterium]MBU1911767.1 AbrB/MazE/SpoVT family DNA-binding domain-containing protein [Patescibacteria group bacterium]
MKTRLTKWGNSLGIRLPKVFAVHLGVDSGEEVDITLKKDSVVISKSSAPTLEELLTKVTPENMHEEIDTGPVTGKEIW